MNQNAEFRMVGPEDVHVIGLLRQQCWAASYRGIYPDEMIDHFDFDWHARRDRAFIEKAGHQTFLILLNHVPVGYMSARVAAPAMLVSLYLLPAYQRQGLGKAAFAQMRRLCEQAGQKSFRCECHPDNGKALAFYQHLGGVITAREECEETWQSSVTLQFVIN